MGNQRVMKRRIDAAVSLIRGTTTVLVRLSAGGWPRPPRDFTTRGQNVRDRDLVRLSRVIRLTACRWRRRAEDSRGRKRNGRAIRDSRDELRRASDGKRHMIIRLIIRLKPSYGSISRRTMTINATTRPRRLRINCSRHDEFPFFCMGHVNA